jgi:hypothetical protein
MTLPFDPNLGCSKRFATVNNLRLMCIAATVENPGKDRPFRPFIAPQAWRWPHAGYPDARQNRRLANG